MTKRNTGSSDHISSSERDLVTELLRRGASRRELLGFVAAAGAVAGAGAGGLLAGSSRAWAAGTPKKGGSIRVAGFSSSTADTLDPAKQSLSTDYARCNMFYNGLFDLDEHLAPKLALAESVDNQKATVWTIKLRKGVTFHDGSSLNADDVVYSLARHKDPAVGSKAKALADQMKDIKATGPLEVTITLEGPNADLPVVLGTFHFKIIKNGTKTFTTANGTGPFKCKEFTPGVRSIAVRNEHYWRSPGPYLDQIEFFAIADDTARVNALLSGDVALIGSINPRVSKEVKAQNFDILETASGGYTDLIMRVDMPPGQNKDFVLGMKYLQDREQMRTQIFRGYATIANDQPIPPSNRYYANLPQRPFDLDKAKFHLKKAGVLGSKVTVVASPAADNSVDMAVLLQDAARKAGFTLDVQKVPSGGYWSNYWTKSPVGYGNINPRPTADILFSLLFKSDAAWNESHWKNPKFDQLLVAARGETDDAKRKQMYGDMQKMIHDDAGIGIPVFINNLDAYSPKLKGLKPMPTGGMMGYDFGEYVWLDA